MHLPLLLIAKLPRLRGAFLPSRAGCLQAPSVPRLADAERCERVRGEMLARLQGCEGARAAALRRRLQAAADLETLWHLRVRLMQLLADARGETFARGAVAAVDDSFRAHWPQAPVSRRAALR